MTSFDTIIRGGRVVDGTGSASFYADVGVIDGRIAEVGDLSGREAATVIDAKGKIVAPGHVTQHAHYDVALFWDPYCSNAGENGVTTVVNGNCGFSVAPVHPHDIERTMKMLETTEQIPVSHQRVALPWDWEGFPDFLERIGQLPKGVNVATYLPLNPLLIFVMGVDGAKTRSPTPSEQAELHRLINEAMDAGAIGLSMSVMGEEGNSHVDYDGTPMPTDHMPHDAILDICRAVTDRGEGVLQMLSQIITYGDRSISARAAAMTKGSGARVLHNAFVTTDSMPERPESDLAWLDGLRDEGCDVVASIMINRGWMEMDIRQLDVVAGQLAGVRAMTGAQSKEELLRLLNDPEFRREFAAENAERGPAHGAGINSLTVIEVGSDPELQKYRDRTLTEIGQAEGRDVVDVLIDLALKSDLQVQLKSGYVCALDPSQAVRLLRHSGTCTGGSDGGAHTKTFGMGHVPTDLLIWLVREKKLMTLEEMHFQMALKQARSVQIHDRGALLPGMWADILVYDLDELYFDLSRYEIVHDMPQGDWRRKSRAGGYEYIIVNGVVTHRRDRPTGKHPGQMVRTTTDRRPRYAQAAE
jgi:N-acyl-D-aspartate/D-glutamate deacylase